MVKSEQEFEEGKPMEEYAEDSKLVDELNSLQIEPEPNPDAGQRLETVVEEPVRNEKQKKKSEAAVKITAAVSVPKVEPKIVQPAQEVPVEVAAEPKIVSAEQPLPQQQTPEQDAPQQVQPEQKFNGIDDYIARAGQQIEENYVAAGKEARRTFINNSYGNLLGIISGEYVVVPRQAVVEQPQTQQVQAAESKPFTKDDLREIVEDVVSKKLEKVVSVQTQMPQSAPTIAPKLVKPKGRWSLKMTGAAIAVFLAVGVIIILTINALH